jgi:hypothetical protein
MEEKHWLNLCKLNLPYEIKALLYTRYAAIIHGF